MNKKSKYLVLILLILIIAIAITVTIATVNIVMHINKIKAIESEKTEMTYQVNSVSGDNMDITIKIKNRYGIDKVITPDGREILSHGRTRLGIDYKVIDGQTYYVDLQIKGTTSLQRYTLNATKENKINITETQASAYPLLTEYGVELNKYVQIDYGDNEDNYYSIDDGQTWNKYEGTIGIHKDCTLIAKSITDDISKELSKEIKLNLASDAIPMEACMNSANNYQVVGSQKRMDISPEVRNKYISFFHKYRGFIHVKFFDDSNTQLFTTRLNTDASGNGQEDKVKIHNDATYMIIYGENESYSYTYLSQIVLNDEPEFTVNQYYPVLTSAGIEKGYSIVTISYHSTNVQKLYKIDDGEWQEYNNQGIRIGTNHNLYAKGIDENGTESRRVSVYECKLRSDAIPEEAYEDTSNHYRVVETEKRINISPEMQGQYVSFFHKYRGFIHVKFFDDSNTQLSTTRLNTDASGNGLEDKVKIHNDATYMIIYGQNESYSYTYLSRIHKSN